MTTTATTPLQTLYRPRLSLLTDLYQVTMAYGYWKTGQAERPAVFHLFYRQQPFDGHYALCAGLELVVDYLRQLRFDHAEVQYLGGLRGADGERLFDE
ncbi:MAG: nicotinate phosphoribosyltransferase, partial [Bacteroidota bacterium]